MTVPLACKGVTTYTFYFNILYSILFLYEDPVLIKSFGTHILPFFILSQYFSWYKLLLYKCNFKQWNTMHYIFVDFISHWLVPLLFIKFIVKSDFINIPLNYSGLVIGFISLAIYLQHYKPKEVYLISLKKLILPYLSLFLISFYYINKYTLSKI